MKFWKTKSELFAFCALFLIASFILFYNLGASPVHDWDEGFYALMAKDTGRYGAIPSINGLLWLEKPPLGVWLISLSFHIFGFSAFSLRLSSAIFAFASVLLCFLLGKKLISTWGGFFASIMLLISPLFVYPQHMARSGDLDTMLLFSTIGAFLFYVYSWKNPKMIIGSGAMLGLGLMFRGSPMVIIGFIIALHALLIRKQHIITWKYWVLWCVSAALIAVPWHLYAFISYPNEFIHVYLSSSFLGRAFGVIQGHSGPIHYYLDFILWLLAHLTLVFVMSMFWLFRKSYKKNPESLLITLWFIVIFCIISFMKTKLFWYTMPLLPAIFLSITLFIKDLFTFRHEKYIYAATGLFWVAWLADVPKNLLHWNFERRAIVLVLVCIISYAVYVLIKRNYHVSSLRISHLLLISIVLVFVGNGAIRSTKNIVFPSTDLPIKQLARELSDRRIADVSVLVPEYGWIHGWLLPQVEWYLNVENHVNAHFIASENIARQVKYLNSGWIVVDAEDLRLLDDEPLTYTIDFASGNLLVLRIELTK